jgi:hypothetical protein
MTYRETILLLINSHQGIKATDLIVKCMSYINPSVLQKDEYELTLNKLVHEGEIIELKYILPIMEYRIKSIYFPKGTKFYEQ